MQSLYMIIIIVSIIGLIIAIYKPDLLSISTNKKNEDEINVLLVSGLFVSMVVSIILFNMGHKITMKEKRIAEGAIRLEQDTKILASKEKRQIEREKRIKLEKEEIKEIAESAKIKKAEGEDRRREEEKIDSERRRKLIEESKQPLEEAPQQENSRTVNKTSENTGETLSQEQAVGKAKQYLNISSFSRDGLIHQLVQGDKFSNQDATYGVDQIGF